MNVRETIESLHLLLNNITGSEEEKTTVINDVKPSSTVFVLETAIEKLWEYVDFDILN